MSNPSEELGYAIAILAEKLTDDEDWFHKKIWKKLSGIHIARASKYDMMLILYRIRCIIIRNKAVKISIIWARVHNFVLASRACSVLPGNASMSTSLYVQPMRSHLKLRQNPP